MAFMLIPPAFNYSGSVQNRTYNALFPSTPATRDRPAPAILLLHGNGADASAMALEQNMTQRAVADGFYLIYPEGFENASSRLRCKERSWNAGSCCDSALLNASDDVGFLGAVLDDILLRFPVDKERVFFSGTSNGGSMALRAMCELADRIAGVAVDIPSFEPFDGSSCASRCTSGDDGYAYCDWDAGRKGCTVDDWITLPPIFSCAKLKTHRVPLLIFNGLLDPVGNISGQVSFPIDAQMPDGYNTSFPPMSYVPHFVLQQYGCDPSLHPAVSFQNGTLGNATQCQTWSCDTNVTMCFADAGHRWYGDVYDRYAVCRYEGYAEEDCNLDDDLLSYGPNTESVHVTEEIHDFFGRVAAPD